MPAVRRSARASRDLAVIRSWIARHDPVAADRVVKAIIAGLAILRDHPFAGPPAVELGPEVRRLVIGSYTAFYVVRDAVVIQRVLAQRALDPERLRPLPPGDDNAGGTG
jgi:toxin ParE1/3/4